MSASRSHHIVSRGFLRQFARTVTPQDGRKPWHPITLVQKPSRKPVPVSIRNAFTSRDFNTRWLDPELTERDDRLENEWGRIESDAIPGMRAVIDGDRSVDALGAVRVMMAMHLARSYAHRIVFDRTAAQLIADFPGQMAASEETLEHFRRDYGREPAPGEVEQIVLNMWAERDAMNLLHTKNLPDTYNKILEHLGPMNLELVHAVGSRVGFVVGDIPVVLWRKGWLGGGPHQGLALMEAEQIFMPLSPTLGAAISTQPKAEIAMDPTGVVELNRLTWNAAVKVVGCHPDLDWERCLSFRPHPITGESDATSTHP